MIKHKRWMSHAFFLKVSNSLELDPWGTAVVNVNNLTLGGMKGTYFLDSSEEENTDTNTIYYLKVYT